MPLISLEYTQNIPFDLELKTFIAELQGVIVEIAHADLSSCKSRIIQHQEYYIGDGNEKNAFVLLTVELLDGRSEAVKKQLGQTLLAKLKNNLAVAMTSFNLQICVQIKDIERQYYFKYIS